MIADALRAEIEIFAATKCRRNLLFRMAEEGTVDAVCIRAYLTKAGKPMPAAAAFGIANPVTGDQVRMTNHHWHFSILALQKGSIPREVTARDFVSLNSSDSL